MDSVVWNFHTEGLFCLTAERTCPSCGAYLTLFFDFDGRMNPPEGVIPHSKKAHTYIHTDPLFDVESREKNRSLPVFAWARILTTQRTRAHAHFEDLARAMTPDRASESRKEGMNRVKRERGERFHFPFFEFNKIPLSKTKNSFFERLCADNSVYITTALMNEVDDSFKLSNV